MADRIAVMREGEIVQCGTPMELYKKPKEAFVKEYFGDTVYLEGQVKDGKFQGENVSFEVEAKDGEYILSQELHKVVRKNEVDNE